MRNDGTERAAGGLPPTLYAGTGDGSMANPASGVDVELDSEEARHVRSLRLNEGDEVLVTDGAGARWLARVEEAARREVRCTLLEPWPAAPPLPLSLWAPVGNKDRSLWLVEKATELGVSEIRFIECERSLSVADAGRSPGFLDRARRRAIAALKQSGAAVLPELVGPQPLADALSRPSAGGMRWIGDRAGRPLGRAAPAAAAVWFVGPEGGLTSAEREACREAGFEPASLGPRTLRFETAAMAGVAILAASLDSDRGSDRGPPAGPARGAREAEQGGPG